MLHDILCMCLLISVMFSSCSLSLALSCPSYVSTSPIKNTQNPMSATLIPIKVENQASVHFLYLRHH